MEADWIYIGLHYITIRGIPFILLSRYMSQRMLCVKGFFPLCNPYTKQTIQTIQMCQAQCAHRQLTNQRKSICYYNQREELLLIASILSYTYNKYMALFMYFVSLQHISSTYLYFPSSPVSVQPPSQGSDVRRTVNDTDLSYLLLSAPFTAFKANHASNFSPIYTVFSLIGHQLWFPNPNISKHHGMNESYGSLQ